MAEFMTCKLPCYILMFYTGTPTQPCLDRSQQSPGKTQKAHDTDDELSDDDRDHRRTNKRSRSKSQSPSVHSQNRHRISPHRRWYILPSGFSYALH